jgi:adenosine deaminase
MTAVWLNGLPKFDLHVHLDGSLRPATVRALLAQLGAEERSALPTDPERAVLPPVPCPLETYLEAFRVTVALLQTLEALERAAFELVEDAARENVIYIEIRFAPLLHLARGLSPERVMEAVLKGMRRAEERYPIRTGLIVCGLKHEKSACVEEAARLAAAYADQGAVAFDLAGPERGFPCSLHCRATEIALDAGLHLTLHAGEGCCPEHIRDALDLGAERIGHGVYLYQDEATERRVAEEGVPLEVCPTSNLHISGFMRTLADHPLPRYLGLGIPVTLNTDNRLMSQTSSTEELRRVVEAFSLSKEEVKRILLASADAAFAPKAVKAALRERVEAAF